MIEHIKSKLFAAYLLITSLIAGTNIGKISIARALHERLLFIFRSVPIKVNNYLIFTGDKSDRYFDVGQSLRGDGNMEPYTTSIFKRVVVEDMTVIDVGANIGYYTLLASSLTGGKGRVFAFEPDPDNYAILIKNIKLNGYSNITPIQIAASDKNGASIFFQYNSTGWSSLLNSHAGPVREIPVKTVSLDDYFNDKGPIDVVKIDVEGAEILVLQGMKRIIENNSNIKFFIEFNPGCIEKAGFSKIQFWDTMISCGLKYFYMIDERYFQIERVEFENMVGIYNKRFESVGSVNLLCTRMPVDWPTAQSR